MRTRNWGPKGATGVQWVGARVLPIIQQCTRQSPPNQERRACQHSPLRPCLLAAEARGRWHLACIHPILGPWKTAGREWVAFHFPAKSRKPFRRSRLTQGPPARKTEKGLWFPGPASSGLHTPHPQLFLFLPHNFAFSKFDRYATSVGCHK